MTITSGAAGATGVLPRRNFFRSSSLLLLRFVFLSIYSANGDKEKLADTAVPAHGYIPQSTSNFVLVDDNPTSAFRDKQDAGGMEPSARISGGDSAGSSPMTAEIRPEELGLIQDSQAVTARRRGEEEESHLITRETLGRLNTVIVLQEEGIVYCPIPKVASSEWKRALRWMVGIEKWEGSRSSLHKLGPNGLERLTDRGLEETRWAFESDRFVKFVVVRDPAERLVSGFLNKCVKEGYESVGLSAQGAQNCPYLNLMPELFPNTNKASLATHARFKDLMETDPEDVFFHFASGLHRQVESHGGDSCMISNVHYRPQSCFCDLMNLLSAFHVMPFAELSAEAEALTGRLPAALPDSSIDLEVTGADSVTASHRRTGVSEERREEIRQFFIQRFTEYHKVDPMGATKAAESKDKFLSERVLEVIHKMYAQDYELFAEYL